MTSITTERLKVGLCIPLDHSWKKHPFFRNSFQITSAKDIQAIREHGLTKISFDPEKSSLEAIHLLIQASETADSEYSDGSDTHVKAQNVIQKEDIAQKPPEQDSAGTPIGEITTEM